MPESPAAALALLERAFNGPVPEAARRIALLGSRETALLIAARAEAAFFRAMVRGQLRALRRRRAAGTLYPAFRRDLAIYWRHYRAWQREAATLGRALRLNKKGPRQARPKFREEKPEGLTARTELNQPRAARWL
jgi:hypothetical protein